MKSSVRLAMWRRLVAVLSVLAVALGLAPHDLATHGRGPSLTPPGLPELRATPPAPLPVPHDSGALPTLVAPPVAPQGPERGARVRAKPGFAPSARHQSGRLQLEGG